MKSILTAFEQCPKGNAIRTSEKLHKVFVTILFALCCTGYAFGQITGTVFRDFNSNGTKDASETGVGGITVSAYDDNDPIGAPTATTVTNSTGPAAANVGTYTLTGLAAGITYRVEFSWASTGAGHLGHLSPGSAGGTSVQFVTDGTGNVNLGLSPDGQYCPPTGSIDIITAIAISGDPFAPGNNLSNDDILKRVDYLAANTSPAPDGLAKASQVGGYLHGLAKDPVNERVFGANTLKRHVSFGPDRNNPSSDGEGGAIYMTNLAGTLPNASIYIDLVNDLGIDIGQALIPNNAGRGLPAIKGNPSLDAAVFSQIGKMGLGDLEISDDGALLFVVNLFDRRVYQIPTADVDNGAPYSYSVIPDFPNYASGCTNGVQRPYGLSFHDGDLYLGVVCTGETNTTTNTNTDLTAFVYRYDLNNSSGGGWSTVITFPLTYQKGFAFYNEAGTNQWYNWTDVFSYVGNLSEGSMQNAGTFGGNMFRPQPILADIEFDEDGSMVLGFMDRTGHQLGHRNAWPTNINFLTTAVTGGDVLRTYLNPATGTFVLENAGVAGPYSSSGTGTGQQGPGGPVSNQGPGGGEFFWRDYGNNAFNQTAHSETSNGGLAICPGTREVVLSAYDPLDELDSGGYIVFDNNNGSKTRGYRLYIDDGFPPASGTTGKGNGVGDIEFIIGAVPIEVGNRVWNDMDQDGVQDPTENGIAGLTLQLWADTDNNGSVDTQVAQTTTDANGRYLFSKSGTNTLGQTEIWTFFAGDNDQIEPSRAYEIRLNTTQAPLSGFNLTAQNSAASGGISTNNNITDLRDSDGTLSSGNAVIAFTTGGQGENNHTLDLGFSMPACAITLTTTVSGCYQSGGISKATVSVEVAWNNGPTGENIIVTYAGQTRTIVPGPYTSTGGNGTIVSPQVVAFEVDANGATGQTVTANFVTTTTCSATSTPFNIPAACPPTVCAAGQTGGMVFSDYNTNGIKEAGETSGLAGVTVNAYDCNGVLVGTTQTDGFGKYAFTGLTAASYPIRVEFSGFPAFYGQGTINGTNGRTTTQFVSSANCNIDLGILDPNDYCQTNPRVFVPSYVYGDPQVGSAAGLKDALVAFDYSAEGYKDPSKLTAIAKAQEVGTLWGMAYNKNTSKIFAAATLKRHAGLGPEGLGGIYVLNATGGVATSWDVNADMGINVGSFPNNAARGLSTDPTLPSADAPAFPAIGTIGIGDIDLSEDGNKIWLVNQFDKKLYSIDITTYNTSNTAPTAANVASFSIPDPACTGGSARPFATKTYKNKVYVGVICDAFTSQNKSNLRAFVYSYDPTTNTWATVFDFPLTYPKGFAWSEAKGITGWFPWSDDFNSKLEPTGNVIHPEPILTDIEFDIDGSMVLGFGDRTGFQTGSANYSPSGTGNHSGFNGGDVLRASLINGVFVLENNAKAASVVGYGPNNNQGSGFGEFYNDDFLIELTFFGPQPLYLNHSENVVGGLALRPGSGEIAVVTMDPVNSGVYPTPPGFDRNNLTGPAYPELSSGGIRYISNATGGLNRALQVYQSSSPNANFTIVYPLDGGFGKATGLGDLELGCGTPTYLQIGNYAWVDADQDGTQDPCEAALPGLKVSLYDKTTNTFLASTTTNANGEYYFTGTGTAGENWAASTGVNSTLQPNTQYTIAFGYDGSMAMSQYNTGTSQLIVNGATYTITTADSGEGANPDLNDSDAAAMAVVGQPYTNYPISMITTGVMGSVNHTYDMGVVCVPPTATFSQTAPTCNVAIANNNGIITFATATAVTNFGISTVGAATYNGPAYPATTFTAVGQNVSTTIPNTGGTYIVRVFNGAAGCYLDVPVTVAPVNCSCPTLSVSIVENNVNVCGTGVATFNYTVVNGPTTTFSHNGGGNLSLSQLPNGTGTFTYTPVAGDFGNTITITATIADPDGAGPCTGSTDMATVSVSNPATANTGGPDNVCQSATPAAITLSGASVGGGATTGAWSIITGGGTLSSTAQTGSPATVTYTPAANFTGTVTLRLTTDDPAGACDPVSADRTITVDPLATVNADGPDNVCQSATPTAITLGGASIGGGATTGAWSIITGGGTLSSTAQTGSPATVTYTPAANYTGTVTLRLTTDDPAGACGPVSADRTITIDPLPTVNAGGPDNVCQSATPTAITLSSASVGGGATTGAWSIITGGGTLSSTAQTGSPATVTYTPAANFTGTVTLRLTTDDPAGACNPATADRIITVAAIPSASLTQTAPTCSGNTANNNGAIILSSATNGTHYGVSSINAGTYNGPATIAAALAIPGTLPASILATVPNTGGSYIVRIFNGTDGCYTDYPIAVSEVSCGCPNPPAVNIVQTSITVCALSTVVFNYTVTNGPTTAFAHNGAGSLSLVQLPNGTGTFTYSPAAADAGNTITITATIADPDGAGPCTGVSDMATVTVAVPPALTATGGSVCLGGSINLASLITSSGGGTLSYYTTQANAVSGTSPLASTTVSPAAATNYYIRSTNANGCFSVQEVVVTIQPAACGPIQISGPN